jgi:hypothetical protein
MKTKDVSYRAVYKSDHLGVVDLEEMQENKQTMVVTIKEVWQETGTMVAGTKGNFNIAYFVEPIKPLVLNSTNAQTVRRLCNGGANLSTWTMPVQVELWIDANVKMKGQIVGGVRLKKPLNVAPSVSDVNALATLSKCTTLAELQAAYTALPSNEKTLATVIAKKDELKTILS